MISRAAFCFPMRCTGALETGSTPTIPLADGLCLPTLAYEGPDPSCSAKIIRPRDAPTLQRTYCPIGCNSATAAHLQEP